MEADTNEVKLLKLDHSDMSKMLLKLFINLDDHLLGIFTTKSPV